MRGLSGLGRNSAWNLAEVALSSLILFILYRLILGHLGVTALGVWSLVLATTSMARVADLGAAGGLGRYVALAQAKNEPSETSLIYVETALFTNTILYLALGAVIYWPAWWALGHFTRGESIEEARRLLPYAIASFTLQNISNVVASALIGFHRSYQKSMLMLFTLTIQGAVALATVKVLGLRGIALAQIVQYVLLLCLGWALVVRAATGSFSLLIPHRMGISALRDLLGFGARLQALNIASFLYEPVTKFVLSSTLGLATLGLYEVASRGILQVRQVLVAPSQNLTPLFTAEMHANPEGVPILYRRAFITMSLAATAAMGAMAVGSPIISFIWLSRLEPAFVIFSIILAIGWFANIISVPGYYLGIASAHMRWNMAGGALTAVLAPTAAYLLAKLLGAPGAAVGAMSGVAGGALLTAVFNCRAQRLSFAPSLSHFGEEISRGYSVARRLLGRERLEKV